MLSWPGCLPAMAAVSRATQLWMLRRGRACHGVTGLQSAEAVRTGICHIEVGELCRLLLPGWAVIRLLPGRSASDGRSCSGALTRRWQLRHCRVGSEELQWRLKSQTVGFHVPCMHDFRS